MSKVNEDFNPNVKSSKAPLGLNFVKAEAKHVQGVFELMFIRNPKIDKEILHKRLTREIIEISNGIDYGLFVSILDGEVVGFCRFFTSDNTPLEKAKFDHPSGMYCMGIIVHPNYRRMGIARYLFDKRLEVIKSLGVKEIFSMVDLDNPTSLSMHESFGFREIERGPGFFIVAFDCGEGILFQKNID
jgi:ribosomal protein S18 acetylase RimI-like enzyme